MRAWLALVPVVILASGAALTTDAKASATPQIKPPATTAPDEAWLTPPRGRPRWDLECLPVPPSRIFEVPELTRLESIKMLRDRPFAHLDSSTLAKLLPAQKFDPRAMGHIAASHLEADAKSNDDHARTIPVSAFEAEKEKERWRWSAAYFRFLAAYNRLAAFQLKPYLVRAVALSRAKEESPLAFDVVECGRSIAVDHVAGAEAQAVQRRPLVVFLPNEPSEVFVGAQGLETCERRCDQR
jgi:hypothetical protein